MQRKGINFKTVILSFLIVAVELAFGADWSYDNVNSWSQKFRECGGRMQSPVNLPATIARSRNLAPSLQLSHYGDFLSGVAKLVNNGHTIRIEPEDATEQSNALIRIVNNGRRFDYKPIQFHFHWGAPGGRPGSEHKINNQQFDAEMHIVHQNTDRNAEAKYGLAVFGIMLQIADEPDKDYPALDKVINKLSAVKAFESEAVIEEGINLEDLLSDVNIRSYYSYQGSLTTPPCSETVTWFVFTNVLQISRSKMNRFFTIEGSHGHRLLSNFRPVQPLGNRTIFFSRGF